MKKTILSLPLLLTFIACDSGNEGTTQQTEMLCTPGQSDACACDNGLEGAQVCTEDGMAFGECSCEEASADSCIPGELDVCACDENSFGMRECGEDEAFGECLCEGGDTGGGNDIPHTQWVLRDKDGEVVNAVFEPVQGQGEHGDPPSGHEKDLPCIELRYLDGNPVWTQYELSSGSIATCYRNYPSWNDSPGVYYKDSECKNPISLVPSSKAHLKDFWLHRINVIDGVPFSADYSNNIGPITDYYRLVSGNSECIEESYEDSFFEEAFEYKEVPISEASLLLEGAPYSISLE